MPPPQAVRRRTTVTRAPRSRARLISATNSRRFVAKPRTPHPIPQAAQLFKCRSANVRGRGARPLVFLSGVQGGYSLSRKRVSPLLRTLRHAGNKVQSTALPKIPPFGKEKRTPLPRRSSYFCESKIYRYFCMPSVARAGSPETEMVNLTPVALLKRSSSFRKSSAAWLHSPPVILNRLSMKMWEIS